MMYLTVSFRKHVIIALSLFLMVLNMQSSQGNEVAKSENCNLQPQIVLSKNEFKQGELIGINFLLTNIGTISCRLPEDILPEGWLIRLEVKTKEGSIVYLSPIKKVEMKADKIQKQLALGPGHSHGVDIVLNKPLIAGDYQIQGTFTTKPLAGRKIQGVPIGTWVTSVVKFKVVKP